MGRPRKTPLPDEEPTTEELETIEEEVVEESELENQLKRQKGLLLLRELMVNEGFDTLGKLDVVLSQVNQRVAELSK